MKQLLTALISSMMLLALGTVANGQDQLSSKPIDQSNSETRVDLSPYLQTGSTASQVASAIAFLDSCTVPITFEEARDDNRWILTVVCSEEENAAAVELEFRPHNTPGAFPFLEPLSFTAIP